MSHDGPNAAALSFGPYEVLTRVGAGGIGTVYKARHRGTGDIVALKVLPPHMAANATIVQRFAKEFRATRLLNHPHVVRALDFGDAGGTPYLVMEFVEGVSLGERIERHGPLPETEAIHLIAQVAEGLAEAHRQGLIHRDVKPDNILVTPDGQAKLIDLGLVKETETDHGLTRTGRGLGTPHFMAPEQFRGAKNVDLRCDIYSLGATLYQLVTGRLPFEAAGGPVEALTKKIHNDLTPPRLLAPGLSPHVERTILLAMRAERERRPANCQAFLDLLHGLAVPVEAEPPRSLWHLEYREADGRPRTAAGTAAQVRGWFTDGRMRDVREVRASRTEAGPFRALADVDELRDLVAPRVPTPEPDLLPKPSPEERPAMGILELATVFVVTLGAALIAGHFLFR